MNRGRRIRFYCGLQNHSGRVAKVIYEYVMDTYFPKGYTCFEATGVWECVREPSVIFEVVTRTADFSTVYARNVADRLRKAGEQQSVLVTVEEIRLEFVEG